ncbi:hypothetical protein UlMin_014024 [Ulmus minor]
MEKTELVFIPFPGKGHLVSMIQLAKQFVDRDDRFSATILGIKSPFESASDSNNSPPIDASNPSIRYFDVKPLDPPSSETSRENYRKHYMESHNSPIKDIITNHVLTKPVSFAGLVVDLFCTSMIDVAEELGVPSYVFFTSGAAFLGFMFYHLSRHEQDGVTEFNESDPESNISSYTNQVPARVFPSLTLNKQGFAACVNITRGMKKSKGIIVNSLQEMESHAIASFRDGETPPVYPVGPLLDLNAKNPDQTQRDKIVTWLDHQPIKSVVFLCFGSHGSFSAPQLREIAIGLEKSGKRFLWSVRKAQQEGRPPGDFTNDELVEILPEGFLERTKEKGMLCGWAPQVEVLAHKATGGFVSHCGWNSTLESLWFGVPLVTWPLYAEQQLNAFQMVRELGLAVELRLDSRTDGGDVVIADEIEKAVIRVMEDDCEVRERVEEMREKLRRGVGKGGSSFKSFGRLIEDILTNIS